MIMISNEMQFWLHSAILSDIILECLAFFTFVMK